MRRRHPVTRRVRLVRGMSAIVTLLAACSAENRGEVRDPNRGQFPGGISDDVSFPTSNLISAAPSPVSPPDGARYDHFPRHTVVVWTHVPGATSYLVEIQFCPSTGCSDSTATRLGRATAYGNAFGFDFVGSQPGRWRVQGIDSSGAVGPLSAWSGFTYQR